MCAESELSIPLLLISGLYHCFRGDGTLSVDDFATEKTLSATWRRWQAGLGIDGAAHALTTMWATWQVWELISSVRSLKQRARCQISLRPRVRWKNFGYRDFRSLNRDLQST